MHKTYLIVFSMCAFGLFLMSYPSKVSAANCIKWGDAKCTGTYNCTYHTCCGWTTPCEKYDDGNYDCVRFGTCANQCNPGEYACNRSGGCCPNGSDTPGPPTGTPDPGSGPGSGGCTVTAPTNLTSTSVSSSSVDLTWTPGTGGSYQALWVSTDPNPQAGCAGSAGGTATCPVRKDSSTVPLASDTVAYTVNNILPNTIYYWEVMNVETTSCTALGYAIFPCGLSPSSLTINQGQSRTLTSSISSGTNIQNVTFASSSPTNLTVNPASDPTYLFQTLVSAILQGSASITSNVYLTGNVLACTSVTPVTILPPSPWWQVQDSDIQSAGDLTSSVVGTGNYFNLDGTGGFPGVTSYGTTTNLTSAKVSSKGWLTQSLPINQRGYDYAYFANQIPDEILATTNTVDVGDVTASLTSSEAIHDSNDYYWYKYDGATNGGQDLTIPETDLGTRKVILTVKNANVNIAGNVNLTDGEGLFVLIVNGNINVDPTVGGGTSPNLEGIYLASGSFNSGVGNTKLWVRGSVVGDTGVNMQRDLGSVANGSQSSELYEYAPDLIMLYPSKLGVRKINWKEVAP